MEHDRESGDMLRDLEAGILEKLVLVFEGQYHEPVDTR